MVSRTSQGCKRKQMVFEPHTLTWIYLNLIPTPTREIGTIIYLLMGRAHSGDIIQSDQKWGSEGAEIRTQICSRPKFKVFLVGWEAFQVRDGSAS